MIDLPPPPPVISYVTPQCVHEIAKHYDLPMALLVAIMSVEGGEVGKESKNTNGTSDYGPMQINTIWLKDLKKYGISKEALRDNGCVNVAAGSWILREKINKNKDKSIWFGIGSYHSKTKELNNWYVSKIKKVLARKLSIFEVIKKANGA